MLRFVLSLSAVLLLLSACTPAKNSQTKADEQKKPSILLNLHDVAILFPLLDWKEVNKNEHLKIALTTKLDGQEGFLSEEKLVKAFRFKDKVFSRYGISALRIDPCANQVKAQGNLELCVPQLRLVWQEYFHNGEKKEFFEPTPDGEPEDRNVHTIYSLSKKDFTDLVGQLRTLHEAAGFDYAKEALGPHPVLLKEGTAGQYYRGLKAIITQFARESNLTHLARFSETGIASGFWRFEAFVFYKGEFLIQDQFSQDLENRMPHHADPRHPASLSERISKEENYKNSFVVENPNLHDPETVDCAACHTSSKVRFILERENKGMPIPKEKYLNPNWNLSLDMEKQLTLDGNPISTSTFSGSFQMFSILKKRYRISQRVINESALGADMINKNYPSLEVPATSDTPICREARSDRDAKGVEDGWGFEDGRSCRVKK